MCIIWLLLNKRSLPGSLIYTGVCVCVVGEGRGGGGLWSCLCTVRMFAPSVSVMRKRVVCPGTRTGTVEVLVVSYDSALQH